MSTLNNSLIVTFKDTSFEEEVLKSSLPVLVDFFFFFFGPCKVIASILAELAEKYAGKIKIGKLNVDENPTTPAKYSVRGVPTLVLFKDGKAEATKVGALSKSQLEDFLNSHLV
mgnify:FL=1